MFGGGMKSAPPTTVEELLARYAAGERYFVGAELDEPRVDMSGVVLDGADLSACWFMTSFRNASLKDTKFCRANVKCCDFSGADLSNADFSEAALEATVWDGAVLAGARFGDVSLYGAHLTEAQFLAAIAEDWSL